MSAERDKVFVEALSLPTRERATLVHKLLLSLEDEAASPEIEAAWKQEALERCEAFDEGKITERAAADVLREAYRKVNCFAETSAAPRLRG
jgi:putative addiction module component (TIGR02574 family)